MVRPSVPKERGGKSLTQNKDKYFRFLGKVWRTSFFIFFYFNNKTCCQPKSLTCFQKNGRAVFFVVFYKYFIFKSEIKLKRQTRHCQLKKKKIQIERGPTHTHTRTHARTHARTHTHTRTHARTHARTHTHTHDLGIMQNMRKFSVQNKKQDKLCFKFYFKL